MKVSQGAVWNLPNLFVKSILKLDYNENLKFFKQTN
jgi:hypothetical protein